jgi:membrane-bound metal-dependent hydrolase YbcI (DUF457 family)
MALLFAAPAWFVWGRRVATSFTAFALVTAMLPDADLYLQAVLPISHHGITHTFLFVIVASLVTAAIAARLLTPWLNDHRLIRSTDISGETVFVFAASGFMVGGFSHIFADMLSAPDIAAPLAPLWPVYREHIVIDVIYYNSPWWNFGLIAVAIALHLVLARYESYPLDTRYRVGSQTAEK